jgi:TRAP-type C4-dicarboxylate transport system substrate-binding protein
MKFAKPDETMDTSRAERRRFLDVASRYGMTTAILASTGGYLWSDPAVAQTGADEETLKKNAKTQMTLATEYRLGSFKGYPILQEQFKENIQSATKGVVYVSLFPAGQLGVGPALAQKVQTGTVHCAAVSLSNFSPFAPIVDVVNIPFWCGESQRFSNLTSSPAWNDDIGPKVNAKGYKPIFYYSVGPRTMSKVKASATAGRVIVKTPADLQGVKVRIPASEMLAQIYRLSGGNPTPVAWGETPTALRQGVADAIDISIGGFWAFGFMDLMASVTLLSQVPDAQMFACNLAWFQALPKAVQTQFEEAGEKTLAQTWEQLPKALDLSMQEMKKLGVQFYSPSAAERKQWVDAAGHQRPEWNAFKVKLAQSLENFDKLLRAADVKSKYSVVDYV